MFMVIKERGEEKKIIKKKYECHGEGSYDLAFRRLKPR